jgi:acyl-homoserine-lactone acylase
MSFLYANRSRSAESSSAQRHAAPTVKLRGRRWLAASAAVVTLAGCSSSVPGTASQNAASQITGPQYQATIVRTADGIPHITADSFGSLGYGYGFALASDDLCTMANGYLTVEGQRSRYFDPTASAPDSPFTNLDSDFFWQSVIDSNTIGKLLAIHTGPDAVGAQLRSLIGGYVAGYNHYLASVGGAAGVPDPTCRGKAWVKPITTLDAYLLVYQIIDMQGEESDIPGIVETQPPTGTTAVAGAATTGTLAADVTGTPASLTALAASVARIVPGADGLPSTRQFRGLAERSAAGQQDAQGSNAIAVGSAGTRNHQGGMLLGNPHFPWDGVDRFYEVQFTIPGTLNVEGATLYGIPLVVIGFTATMAWSQTVSSAFTVTPYQLTLVPGHPTQYVYDGKPVAMTSQTVTVQEASADGTIKPVSRTLWSTRYGPVTTSFQGLPVQWNAQMAFALADANAGSLRFLNHFLATDEAGSVAAEFAVLKDYEGLPWMNTIAADSTGRVLYADIQTTPHVTDAEAGQCDTALGATSFQQIRLPVLDGSRSSCAWGTDGDSAVPGIFGPAEQPSLMGTDFVENSNNSYWLANPAHPLTGYPRIIGPVGKFPGLRAQSALTMVMQRISGTDGLGPAGFTFQDMKNLMFSDVQYGATLVKSQLVSMCRSFPGGAAPTSTGGTIAVSDSCSVLAAWDGRENVGSRGAVLFRRFWQNALSNPAGLFTTPFSAGSPLTTPNGLNTASAAVQQAFGDALAALSAAHLPYDVALGTVQYVVRDGTKIALPGGPGDPNGEFNAIDQPSLQQPGSDPIEGSSYIQDVTWTAGDPCPEAATLLTYSESANPDSPYYADQTEMFSRGQWVTAEFCPAQVAGDTLSTTVVHGS